jgi:hypothetical protein
MFGPDTRSINVGSWATLATGPPIRGIERHSVSALKVNQAGFRTIEA